MVVGSVRMYIKSSMRVFRLNFVTSPEGVRAIVSHAMVVVLLIVSHTMVVVLLIDDMICHCLVDHVV